MATRPSRVLTKKTDIRQEARPSGDWAAALRDFDRALATLGMAEKTRRAYGGDLGELARWATAHEVGPSDMGPRDLRRYAAVLSERGASRATVARKLAAIRTFYRRQIERGAVEASPADLVATPKRESRLPQVLKQGEASALVESIPTGDRLAVRDRAIFELAYAGGLRAEEIVNLDVTDLDADNEELRVTGKGERTRVIPAGEPAWHALRGYLDRARPALAGRLRSRRAGALPLEVRSAPLDLGYPSPPDAVGAARRPSGGLPAWACRHTRSGTRSRPTSSRAAPTSARSRSCSVMPPSARRRRTLAWTTAACAVSMRTRTRAHDSVPGHRLGLGKEESCRTGSRRSN